MKTRLYEGYRWVDMHCHLDLYPDHQALIAESDRERVATLAVTTTPKAWARNAEMASASSHVRVALGLHPQLVKEREAEIVLFERLLSESRYVGEVGLDAGPRYYGSFEAQERVFDRVLRACAEHGDKILTVHSVRAAGRVLRHIENKLPSDRARVILHWFTGSASDARRAVELGCFFSVNSEMLKSTRHRALVAALPIDRIITETDGPFIQSEGRPVRPRSVIGTTAEIAAILGRTQDDIAKQIVSNLVTLQQAL